MKKRIISLALALMMCFSLSVTAFAANEEKTSLRTSEVLDMGTLYHVQNDNFLLYYVVYNEGFVDYAIVFTNNNNQVLSGSFPISQESSLESIEALATSLTNVKASSISIRTPSTSRAIGNEAYALDLCSADSKWIDPFDDQWLGSQTISGVKASLYESATAYADEQNVFYYELEENLTSILAALGGKVSTDLAKAVIVFTYKAGSGYVSQSAGTLKYYHVMNYATKWVEINGTTWYYAGKERAYDVLMTDSSSEYEREYYTDHSDYNNSKSYFFEKAFANYNS